MGRRVRLELSLGLGICDLRISVNVRTDVGTTVAGHDEKLTNANAHVSGLHVRLSLNERARLTTQKEI